MLKIALVGNPNCGKTTVFNLLTGGNQKVGNWPGVTVEKKFGFFEINDKKFELVDLPGIYAFGEHTHPTGYLNHSPPDSKPVRNGHP